MKARELSPEQERRLDRILTQYLEDLDRGLIPDLNLLTKPITLAWQLNRFQTVTNQSAWIAMPCLEIASTNNTKQICVVFIAINA